jgi:hypothetical protein
LNHPVDRASVIGLFEELRASFPSLAMEVNSDVTHPFIDVEMQVRKQPGLPFDVSLQLQGDQLCLSAGAFFLEWFPCTDAEVVAAYRDAATGLLSGSYRVVEHHLGTQIVKARLQRPTPKGWRTIGTWSNMGALIPWPRRRVILGTTAR